MNELVWLIVGLLIGGCLGIGIHCCFLINRTGYYEQEIRKLKAQLERKDKTYLDQYVLRRYQSPRDDWYRLFCVYGAIEPSRK